MTDLPQGLGSRRGWSLWGFVVFMLVLMGLFVALGVWQVERLGEKERLIANVAARFDQPPISLPPFGEWAAFDPEAYNFRPVSFAGSWLPQQSVLVFTSLGEDAKGQHSGPGYWVMTPLALTGGGTIFVNRGFIPEESRDAFAKGGAVETGIVNLSGIARASEETGAFTPAPDLARRVEWVRTISRLTAMAGPFPDLVAPVYVDLPAGPLGALPQGGETVMEFPNNHLGYAATWFGFALLVPILLVFWLRRQRRPAPKP